MKPVNPFLIGLVTAILSLQCGSDYSDGTGHRGEAIAYGTLLAGNGQPASAHPITFADSTHIAGASDTVITTVTDSSGRYAVALPEGRWRMAARSSSGFLYLMIAVVKDQQTDLGTLRQEEGHSVTLDGTFAQSGTGTIIAIPGTEWQIPADSVGPVVFPSGNIEVVKVSASDTITIPLEGTASALSDPITSYLPTYTTAIDSATQRVRLTITNFLPAYRYHVVIGDTATGTILDTVFSASVLSFAIPDTLDSANASVTAGYAPAGSYLSQRATGKIALRTTNPITLFLPTVQLTADTALFSVHLTIANHVTGYQYFVYWSDSTVTTGSDTITTDSCIISIVRDSLNQGPRTLNVSATARNGSSGVFTSKTGNNSLFLPF